MNALLFRAAERTFLSEVTRLDHKIRRQVKDRNTAIQKLNEEMSLKATGLEGKRDPRHP
jgi:hypothetical protein